jgi:hypothetical protein
MARLTRALKELPGGTCRHASVKSGEPPLARTAPELAVPYEPKFGAISPVPVIFELAAG